MSTIAHAASAINVCHAKSTFFGTSKALKAAPVRVHRRVAVAARADAAVWAIPPNATHDVHHRARRFGD